MKTKEQILEELFYKPETQDWYKPVLKAMETYAQQLRQPPVSGLLPPDELEKALGSTNRQFTIWHDGGEWLISLKGKEHEQCKTLREWIGGNGR